MANLVKVDSGATGWDKSIEANFESLNEGIAGVATMSDWSDAGMTLVNGYTADSVSRVGSPGYRFYYVNGVAKVLLIKGSLRAPKGLPAGTNTVAVKFPSVISDFLNTNQEIPTWMNILTDARQILDLSVHTDTNSITLLNHDASDGLTRIPINEIFVA